MSSVSHQLSWNQWPTRTLGVAAVVALVYLGQLLAAGSFASTAAYRWATEFQRGIGAGSVVFSWVLHSSHEHILSNLVVFLLSGWWVESRIEGRRYIQGAAGWLGIGANVAALVVFSEAGRGLSGVTTGLVAMVALGTLQRLSNPNRVEWITISQAIIALFWLSFSVGAIGLLPIGTAVWVHRCGAVFGLVWYMAERYWCGFQKSS